VKKNSPPYKDRFATSTCTSRENTAAETNISIKKIMRNEMVI